MLTSVFTMNETITATSAPQANASERSHEGSGSYLSSQTSGSKYSVAGTKATIAATTAGMIPTLAKSSIITTSDKKMTPKMVNAIPTYRPVFGGSGFTVE